MGIYQCCDPGWQRTRNKNDATAAEIALFIIFFYPLYIKCGIHVQGTETTVRMVGSKQVRINQPACDKIILAQVDLQALLHICLVYVQFFFGEYGVGDEFGDNGKQFRKMLFHAMEGELSSLVARLAVEVGSKIFKEIVDVIGGL